MKALPSTITLMMMAAPLPAQRLPPAAAHAWRPAVQQPAAARPQPDDALGPFLGAASGGLMGLFGVAIATQCHRAPCGFDAVGRGLAVGLPLGAALGAHVGNARRGSLFWDVFGATAAGVASWRLARRSNDGAMALFTLVAPVIVATVVERSTGEGRPPKDTLCLGEGPAH